MAQIEKKTLLDHQAISYKDFKRHLKQSGVVQRLITLTLTWK